MALKASIEPLPELAEFLAPFASHFVRSEGRENLERSGRRDRTNSPFAERGQLASGFAEAG